MDGITFLGIVAGLLALTPIVGIFCAISFALGLVIQSLLPRAGRVKTAIASAGCLPLMILAGFLIVTIAALDEDFRGPEVLGLAIIGGVAAIGLIIAWPVSAWLTYRLLGRRQPKVPERDG